LASLADMKFAFTTFGLLMVAVASDSTENVPRGAPPATLTEVLEPAGIDVSGDTVVSVWKHLVQSVETTLSQPKFQTADAACAGVFGLLMLLNGEIVFKWTMVVATGILVMLVAMSELSSLGMHQHLRGLVALEVFLAATYTASKGLDGIMLGVGGLFGLFLAAKAEPILNLVVSGHFAEHQHQLTAAWYSLFVLGCMSAVVRRGYARFLAIIASILGGALVSSAAAWIAMTASAHGKMNFMTQLVPDLKPGVEAPWFKFFALLVSSDAEDVGLFARTPSDTFQGFWNLDRVLGLSLWFLLFILGTVKQFNALAKQKAAKKIEALETTTLSKPLLEEGHA